MVGLGLDVLDVLRVALGEVLDQLAERAKGARRERLELADGALLRERLQPVELYADAITDERLLAEVDPERVHGPGVPAVERRQRGERRWHGLLLYGDGDFAPPSLAPPTLHPSGKQRGIRLPPVPPVAGAPAGVPRWEERAPARRGSS